jgi:hypothetical protein
MKTLSTIQIRLPRLPKAKKAGIVYVNPGQGYIYDLVQRRELQSFLCTLSFGFVQYDDAAKAFRFPIDFKKELIDAALKAGYQVEQ